MPEQSNVEIRKFRTQDRDAVRNIAYVTAFMGEPASVFCEGRDIVSDALTLYFTDYEPQSCFVAQDKGKVIGCLIGAKDKISSEKVFSDKIAPRLFRKILASGALLKKKNIVFILRLLCSIIKGEFRMPDVVSEYPATFHINIEQDFRGQDIGSRLITAYLDYLKQERVTGVHLATMSSGAAEFFSRQGFHLLYSGKRSYFRHILHKDVPLYIYGKKI